MKTQQQYLKSPNQCPNCGNSSPEYGMLTDDIMPSRSCRCENCHLEWKEFYNLAEYTVTFDPMVELRAVPMIDNSQFDEENHIVGIPSGDLENYDFIRVFVYNPSAEKWTRFSDYRNIAELSLMTGITRLVKSVE